MILSGSQSGPRISIFSKTTPKRKAYKADQSKAGSLGIRQEHHAAGARDRASHSKPGFARAPQQYYPTLGRPVPVSSHLCHGH
jgi:hypothetical protein